MDKNFKCCKKDFNSYCCKNCLGIFHESCLGKKKNVLHLGGHQILCSKSCQEKSNDFTASVKAKLREQVNSLQIEIAEITDKSDTQISLLENELALKNSELNDKDAYILRMRRNTKDFEDEVFEQEQNFQSTIDTQKRQIEELKLEIDRLNKLIRDMEIRCEDYQTRVTSLENELNNFMKQKTLKPNESDNSVKEATPNNAYINFGTNLLAAKARDETRFSNTGLANTVQFLPQRDKSRVLLVSGIQGKHLSSILNHLSDFAVQSLILTNATDITILNSAREFAKSFTKNDIVLLWPNKPHLKLVEDFTLKFQHTNPIILTQLFINGMDATYINQGINQDNLALYRELFLQGMNPRHVFDCNKHFKKSNYTRAGINSTGKRYLATNLLKHLNEVLCFNKLCNTSTNEAEVKEVGVIGAASEALANTTVHVQNFRESQMVERVL